MTGAEAPASDDDATGVAEAPPIEVTDAAPATVPNSRPGLSPRPLASCRKQRSTGSSDRVALPFVELPVRGAVVSGLRQPRCLGQGPDRLSPHRRSAAIARWRRATPTQLTRTPSVATSWRCRLERPTPPGAWAPLFTRPPGECSFRRAHRRPCRFHNTVGFSRAASRPPPRRGVRSAAPKVPSAVGKPEEPATLRTSRTAPFPRGFDLFHRLFPTLWRVSCETPLSRQGQRLHYPHDQLASDTR